MGIKRRGFWEVEFHLAENEREMRNVEIHFPACTERASLMTGRCWMVGWMFGRDMNCQLCETEGFIKHPAVFTCNIYIVLSVCEMAVSSYLNSFTWMSVKHLAEETSVSFSECVESDPTVSCSTGNTKHLIFSSVQLFSSRL